MAVGAGSPAGPGPPPPGKRPGPVPQWPGRGPPNVPAVGPSLVGEVGDRVRSVHDQMRAEKIRSTHRRHGRVCAGCGQSWPCSLIAWAGDAPLSAWTLRWRKVRAVGLIAVVPLTIVGVGYLPTPVLVALFLGIPVAALVALIASRRRP